MSKIGVVLSLPQGDIVTFKTKTGSVSSRIEWNPNFERKSNENFSRAQVYVDSSVMRHMEPYMPFDTGVMARSMTLATTVGSGNVIVNTPYALRRLHEARHNGLRGPNYFERMKADHRQRILAGAAKIAGGKAK